MNKLSPKEELDLAIRVASSAHLETYDKGGAPYILHPLHVMNALSFEKDFTLMAIAVSHDVVEDTDNTIEGYRENGFSERFLIALELLTHKRQDTYAQYINKILTNKDAIKVKIEDIKHNSDITRIKGTTEKDFKRLERYACALRLLQNAPLGLEEDHF